MLNALTIDLEEYFHPTEVQTSAGLDHWTLLPSRLADETKVLLDLLDRRGIKAIEDACGVTPVAYRAPSYSITNKSLWALDVLVECGFTHDSSIYPISHDRYGIPGFPRRSHTIQTPSGPI